MNTLKVLPFTVMTIQDITLGQFQEIYKINKSDLPTEEKLTELVAAISGKTTNEVEELSIPEFNKLSKQVQEVLSSPLPQSKPERTICGYGITYEPAKLTRGQYVTVNHFVSKDVVENCHYIMASLTYNTKTGKHEADKHSEIAEKLQDAKLVDIYPTCVFFCQLFADSMKSLENYLLRQLIQKGMNPMAATEAMTGLMNDLAGSIMPNRSQILRA